jgi:GTPase SAR1 family protein
VVTFNNVEQWMQQID